MIDDLVQFAGSGTANVLVFVAAFLAIPTTLMAMYGWAAGAVHRWRRRRKLGTLVTYIVNEPNLGIATSGPQTTTAMRVEATEQIARAVSAMDFLGVVAGYRLRQHAQLPLNGKINLRHTEAEIIRQGDINEPWHRVYWRVYAVKGMVEQLLSEMRD